jgi:hypothetical protein
MNGHPHLHKEMYDRYTLEHAFAGYGFVGLRWCEYGTSAYMPNVCDVEGRKEGYEGSLYLEGRKGATC